MVAAASDIPTVAGDVAVDDIESSQPLAGPASGAVVSSYLPATVAPAIAADDFRTVDSPRCHVPEMQAAEHTQLAQGVALHSARTDRQEAEAPPVQEVVEPRMS